MKRQDGPVDPLTPTEADGATTPGSEPLPPGPAARGAAGPVTIDAYQLGDLLGRGGMGEVLLAHDPRIGRDVALKRMRAAAPSAELVDRFLREAKVQARLEHPAIVPVHELGLDREGRPYFTMKRLAGRTLAALLESGTETPKRLLRGLVDVCLAVEFAHARRVVHRDLKPSNIMLGDYGEVYVLDWGVARVLADPRLSQPTLGPDIHSLDGEETRAGTLLGTPGYMAPEQARGEDVDTAADVYALGSILFEILAGEPLHPRGPGALASTLVLEDGSPVTRTPDREIAPELDAACVAALDPRPAARPTAGALAAHLQSYLDGDRDLEMRRTIAVEHLAVARAALAAKDPARRSEAVHAAWRALAFDPRSRDAAELVTSLIVEPPRVLPPELEASVAAEEHRMYRDRSRRAIVPHLCFFLLLPFVPLLEVRSWPALLGLSVAVAVVAGLAFINWRIRSVPLPLMLASHFALTMMFSRLSSPFVVAPLLIAGILLAITPIPWINERRWFVLLWTTGLVMTPLLLEALGVVPRSAWPTTEGLLVSGTVFMTKTHAGVLPILIGNLVFSLVIGNYALSLSRDRRAAQRRLRIQTWHLEQLLPRQATLSPG